MIFHIKLVQFLFKIFFNIMKNKRNILHINLCKTFGIFENSLRLKKL